jgi:hypothetical protein
MKQYLLLWQMEVQETLIACPRTVTIRQWGQNVLVVRVMGGKRSLRQVVACGVG